MTQTLVPTRVSAETLRDQLNDGAELALIDLREVGAFSAAHLLFAVCIPLSRIELEVATLIPRLDTRVVLTDEDGQLAERGAGVLTELGYTQVAQLDGGVHGWAAAGFELFSGVNVPSKAFGEFVEHRYHTPDIDADTLHARIAAGENLVVLDSRPLAEFDAMSLPDGICTPGAELVYRVHDIAPDPETTVVVNCAGRTRSIIGAQSLINAGVPNPVVALRNGTMGWHLSGYDLRYGATGEVPETTPGGLQSAQAAAARVAERFGVNTIDPAELDVWRKDRSRTLFLLDVRTQPEFLAGHLPGARHAPGGQLVQATDEYIGVRNARIALTDNDGIRATMTASWLIQLGWPEVAVVKATASARSERGPRPRPAPILDELKPELVSAPTLDRLRQEGRVNLLDLSRSDRFIKAHIPGAEHAIRSRIGQRLPELPNRPWLVFTCETGDLARLAANDYTTATDARVAALMGGNAAWLESGYSLVASEHGAREPAEDIWASPYADSSRLREAMNAYLDWEIALVEQIERDGTATFVAFD
ncbi:MAG: rhodanese-like domain-containing protein [Pseudomonadota bacterium]